MKTEEVSKNLKAGRQLTAVVTCNPCNPPQLGIVLVLTFFLSLNSQFCPKRLNWNLLYNISEILQAHETADFVSIMIILYNLRHKSQIKKKENLT